MSGLEKQTISIPLGGGKDELTHPYLVQPPLVATAKDVLATKNGALVKHPGEGAINASGYPNVLAPTGLFAHGDALCMQTYRGVESLSEANAAWREANAVGWLPVESRVSGLRGSSFSSNRGDCAKAGNYLCQTWAEQTDASVPGGSDATTGFFYRVVEWATGAVVVPPTRIGTLTGMYTTSSTHGPCSPIVVSRGNTEFIFVGRGSGSGGTAVGSMYFHRLPVSTFSLGAVTLLRTPAAGVLRSAQAWCEADGSNSDVYVVTSESVGGLMAHRITASALTSTALFGTGDDIAIDVHYSSTLSRVFVLSYTTFTAPANVQTTFMASNLSGITGPTTVTGMAAANAFPIRGGMVVRSGSGDIFAAWEETLATEDLTTAPPYCCVRWANLTTTGALSGSVGTAYNLAMASKPFRESNHPPYFLAVGDVGYYLPTGVKDGDALNRLGSDPDTERHCWLVAAIDNAAGEKDLCLAAKVIDSDAAATFRGSYPADVAAGSLLVHGRNWLPKFAKIASNQFVGVTSRVSFVAGTAAALQSRHEAVQVAVRLMAFSRAIDAGGLTVLSGGMLGAYDGVLTAEQSIQAAPKIVQAVGPGGVSASTYDYAMVLTWTDDAGKVHRSAPSPTFKTQFTSIVSLRYVVPPTGLDLEANAKDFFVEVYISGDLAAGGDTTLRLATRTAIVAAGVAGLHQINAPTSADAADPPLYTEGGELASEPPPSAIDVVSHAGRLWLVSGEQQDELRATKSLVAGRAPEWNGALAVQSPGPPFVALASMDDKLVAFREKSIWIVTGDGPNDNGEGPGWAVSRIVSDAGCASPASVLVVPEGVLFQGERGIYLLGRDLSVQYVGGAIEDVLDAAAAGGGGGPGFAILGATTQPIIAAVLTPDESTARFASAGRIYNLNLVTGQWTTRENAQAGMALYGRRLARIQADYTAAVESPDDPGGWNSPDNKPLPIIETAWIRLPSELGFQRVWRAEFLLRYFTGDLKIEIGYDWEKAYTNTMTWQQATLISLGSGDATDGYRVIVDARPGRQKCSAIRFRISEVVVNENQPPDVGRGFEVAALTLDVGVKKGARKLLPDAAKK